MKTFSNFALIVIFTFSALVTKAGDADDLLGIWFNQEKDAKIEIYKCGTKFCGKIVWLEEPNEEDGTPKIDDENPDEILQNRPIMGLNILSDFVFEEDNLWEDGDIYDPKEGKTYSCYLKLETEKKLKVRGYIGFSLIGKTNYWTRPE
ncbi:DUF2147 domain-containing protein [Bacteroidota bacterium]